MFTYVSQALAASIVRAMNKSSPDDKGSKYL
jgi:hypothetical protein